MSQILELLINRLNTVRLMKFSLVFISFVFALPGPGATNGKAALKCKATGRAANLPPVNGKNNGKAVETAGKPGAPAAKAIPITKPENKSKGFDQAQSRAGSDVTIFEDVVQPSSGNQTPLRFRVSIPNTPNPALGLNVLLHGDGGASFFEMPNAGIQNNLLGVVIQAPDRNLQWGGADDARSKGPEHVRLVADLIDNVLPKLVDFDSSKIFFTGVSGGSLTLSSAMIPLFGDKYNSGMFLLCGGSPPPQAIPASKLPKRIHFQTTTREFADLKQLISQSVAAVVNSAKAGGLSDAEINNRFTIDSTPTGNHCSFDARGFNSGIQLAVNNFKAIMLDGQGVAMTGNSLRGFIANGRPAVLN
jgi:hypothetical protein